MASKTFQDITACLALSIIFLYNSTASACGWGDDAETLRLAFFRAEARGMAKFSPFYYSEHYFNQYEIHSTQDRWRNCREWQQKLGASVSVDHIYELQYKTDPEKFQLAYGTGTLDTAFRGNTFIKSLLLPKNKPLLEYFAFAKEMEYYQNPQNSKWESWDDTGRRDYWEQNEPQSVSLVHIEKKLAQQNDHFLQQRYAFMLIRYGNPMNIIKLYDQYFANDGNRTILQPWALLLRAYVTEDKAEQNYYLSRVFDLCDEKVIAVMQRFNHDEVERTLAFAKNDHEKAVILAIKAMRSPGPALQEIIRINDLSPGSNYVNMLLGREINKLENWIFTPEMMSAGPEAGSQYAWSQEYIKARTENLQKDMAYLRELKAYIKDISTKGPQDNDYLMSCLAHLCFMDDDIEGGYTYAHAIGNDAPASIKAQKAIEMALVASKQHSLSDTAVQQQFYDAFQQLYALAGQDESYGKSLYSLLKILSAEYNKAGDMATAGLLFLKAENFKYSTDGYGWGEEPESPDYEKVAYFDRLATLNDMDNVVKIIGTKNKSPFHRFICEGTTTDVNFYLDLKGAIALRQNNLQLAYDIYKKIPDAYYEKHYPYSEYLASDPFYPRILYYAKTQAEQNKEYKFNKAVFIKQLIALSKMNDPESCLKLGHAYYNLSYRGSHWLMVSYFQGNLYYDAVYGDMEKAKKTFSGGNYTDLTQAKYWYNKAYKAAPNKEQKAMAALMLHVCEKHTDFSPYYSWDGPRKLQADKWVRVFYKDFKNTKTFKKFSCPELEVYLQ